jgi:hypothetical protein
LGRLPKIKNSPVLSPLKIKNNGGDKIKKDKLDRNKIIGFHDLVERQKMKERTVGKVKLK